jgi:hypothetical protein
MPDAGRGERDRRWFVIGLTTIVAGELTLQRGLVRTRPSDLEQPCRLRDSCQRPDNLGKMPTTAVRAATSEIASVYL